MTPEDDRQQDEYLWDPGAPASADVQVVESRLAALRFDSAQRPIALPAPVPVRGRAWWKPLLAIAASLAVLTASASALWLWRSTWPTGAAWPITIARGAAPQAGVASQLRLDQPLQLDANASAEVRIARIGTMEVQPGSALTITETTSRRHRVLLDRGGVSVRVWAPPGRFAFTTPAGSVIDLGCVFDLSVDAAGTSRVRVRTGWVQIANGWGESLIPAGASSLMTPAARPGVPIFDDAAPVFASSVRAVEQDLNQPPAAAIDATLGAARPRDVVTLLMLAVVSPASSSSARSPLIRRAAELVPPPPGVSLDAIAAGQNDPAWQWYDALDLPPVKGWWLNWRDALPRFH